MRTVVDGRCKNEPEIRFNADDSRHRYTADRGTLNQRVVGSSPTRPTKFRTQNLHISCGFRCLRSRLGRGLG